MNLKTGWISSAGKYIQRFEQDWAAYYGRRYGVAVCNGTVALELAISALFLYPRLKTSNNSWAFRIS